MNTLQFSKQFLFVIAFTVCANFMKSISSTNNLCSLLPQTVSQRQVLIAASSCIWHFQDTIKKLETSPEFPGGLQALGAFIKENKVIPASHRSTDVGGKVHVRFTICADGSISNAEILKSLNEACDKEALRIISLMPKWKPGTVGGEPVAVCFSLPIRF